MMPAEPEIRKFLAPFVKSESGQTLIVLSDSSVDRQGERIAPELIRKWANIGALPALIDHKHSIDAIVAVWKNLRAVEINGHTALVAEPDWLDDEYAQRVRKKVEQLVKKGLRVGVSIGAIPKESRFDKDGVREWVDAELVEASFVAIPANRNAGVWQASYDTAQIVLKGLGIEKEDEGEQIEKASPTLVALVADVMKELKVLKDFVNNSVEDQTVKDGVATIVNRILKTLAVVRDRLAQKDAEGAEMIEKAASKVTVTRRPWTAPKQSERENLPAWVFLDPEHKKYPVFEWRHLLNGGKERILNCNAVRVAIAYAGKYGHAAVKAKAERLYQRYCAKNAKKDIEIKLAKESVPIEEVDDYVENFQCPDCGDFEDFEDEWDETLLTEGDKMTEEEITVEAQVGEEKPIEEPKPEEGQPEEESKAVDVTLEKLAELIERVADRLEKIEEKLAKAEDEADADAPAEEEDEDGAQKSVVPVVEKSVSLSGLIVYRPIRKG